MPDIFDQLAAQPSQQDQGDIFDQLSAKSVPSLPQQTITPDQPQSTWDRLVDLAKTPSPEWLQPSEEAVRGWVSGPPGDIQGINKPLYEPTRVEEGQEVGSRSGIGTPTGETHPASGLEAAGSNMVSSFLSGATNLKGITQMLPPVFLANAIHQAPEMIQQVQRAEETPPWSQARWEAGLNVVSTLGFGGAMLGGLNVADAIKAREPQAVADAVQAQVPELSPEKAALVESANKFLERPQEFSPEQHRAVEMQVQQGVPEEQAAQNVLTTPDEPTQQPPGIGTRNATVEDRAQAYGGEPILPGTGTSWQAQVETGRGFVEAGAIDPDAVGQKVLNGDAITPPEFAAARYRQSQFQNATDQAFELADANSGNPELLKAAQDAYEQENQWTQNVMQPAKNMTSETMRGMQGEQPLDPTTLRGLQRSALDMGQPIKPEEMPEASKIAESSKQAYDSVDAASAKLLDAMDKEYSKGAQGMPKTAAQLRAELAEVDPCAL